MEEVENMEVGDSLEEPSSQSELTSTATMSNSPRQMTSILLILDGMMKGCLSNKDVTLILHGIDTNISIESSTWFNSSYSSSKAIGTLICNRTITDNVVSNFSMAWALLDACSSFVKCATERHGLFDQSGSKCDVEDEVILRVLTSIVFLLGCPREFDVFSHAMKVLDDFSTFHNNGAEPIGRRTLLDTHFRQLLPKIASVGPSFPWQHTDPTMLTMCALLRTSNGSTVGSNFDIVAPFFIHHLSTTGYKVVEKELASTHDDVAEEYSLRISLMSLLQTILSDGSFSETLNDNTSSSSTASFSKQFTTDVLLSLVLPNLVWKAGGLASALRKLSAATLFSLLSHHCIIQHENRNISNEPKTPYPETLTHLIPILHSNLEDTESITRELCCTCLSLVLEQVSKSDFQAMWEANTQIVDTLYPRLLTLLDDSHNPVRVAACRTLEQFLSITHHSPSSSPTCRLELSSFEDITTTLMIQLDDPDQEVQKHVFQTLMVILDLQFQDAKKHNGHHLSEMQIKVVEMMERHSKAALKSHRNGQHCDLLIKKIQEYKQQGMMCTSN